MKKGGLIALIVIFVVLLLAAVAGLLYFMQESKQTKAEMEEMEEVMNFEKEQLEDEYENLAMEFDGYAAEDIHNDSLAELLSKEQQRVQDLLEELRITKATNAHRIAELKKELSTVRAVMVQYVHQIDSLNRQNQQLIEENQVVKKQYNEVNTQKAQLEKQNTHLNEVVTRAAMMDVSNFAWRKLNSHNRKAILFSNIANLEFTYTIQKNITTKPGEKTIYLRLTRPDGEVLCKSPSNVFPY